MKKDVSVELCEHLDLLEHIAEMFSKQIRLLRGRVEALSEPDVEGVAEGKEPPKCLDP